MAKNTRRFSLPLKYLLPILFIVFLLRLPGLFEPNRYADEDIYLTIGQGLRQGLVLYRDIHDNKPPFVYLLAALSFNSVPLFRFILLLWNLVNIVLFYKIAQKIFSPPKTGPPLLKPVFISTLIFALLSSLPLTEGNIANGEIFMIMPATLGLYFLLQNPPRYFLSGLLFSAAFLFKVPIFFDFLALVFWLTFYSTPSLLAAIKKLFSRQILYFLLGFFLPILSTIFYFYLVGAGQTYLTAALLQNLPYLSSWGGGQSSFLSSGLFIRFLIALAAVVVIYLCRRRLPAFLGLFSLYFVAALFGALLSGRPYPHYLIELILPLSFLLVLLFASSHLLPRLIITSLLLLLAFSLKYYHFWYYPSLNYYRHFVSYALGQSSQEQYYHSFGDQVLKNYQIAAFIKDQTTSADRIFVWGTEPAIYALSRRLPVGKYTVAYHIFDFRAENQTLIQLQTYLPKFVVYFPLPDHPFPELNDFLNRYYLPSLNPPPAIVYQLRQ